jgi:hypothetical protein
MFIARNLTYYPGPIKNEDSGELSDEVILPAYYLNTLMREFDDGEMLYIDMKNTNTNQSYLVAIGSSHTYDKNTIFAPQWILDLIGCSGECNTVLKITKADVEDIPAASKIVIKPLDPIAFELDTLACFENALMNIHSIREGITLPVTIPQLGKDYTLFAHIEKVEPGGLARIINGEVDVEFINEFVQDCFTQDNTQDNNKELNSVTPTPNPTPVLAPINNNPCIHPSYFTNNIPVIPRETISDEEKRRQVRESWLKREILSNQNSAKEK